MSNVQSRSNNRTVVWIAIVAAVAIVAFIIAFVIPKTPGGGDYTIADKKVTIGVTSIGKLGPILVTDKGYALYTYAPDSQSAVTCYDRCALHWPPVFLPDGVKVAAGADVNAKLLGEMTDRNGKRVATYNDWPLYLYQGDVTSGTAVGHGQYLDGGYWYVIRPNGEVIMPSPQQ